ncbi:hypothetical protein JCM17380_20530 [Desulfosporosinus burensis]
MQIPQRFGRAREPSSLVKRRNVQTRAEKRSSSVAKPEKRLSTKRPHPLSLDPTPKERFSAKRMLQ